MVDQAAPQSFIELRDGVWQGFHRLDEPPEFPSADTLHSNLGSNLFVPCFGFLKAGDERLIPKVVGFLVLRHPGVLRDDLLDGIRIHVHLLRQPFLLGFQFLRTGERSLHSPQFRENLTPVGEEVVCRPDKSLFDLVLGRTAGLVLELGITLPDHPAVFVRAVLDLRAVPSSATSALDF